MNFLFFNAAGQPLFSRDDAEQAEHTHEEMSLYALFPYDQDKVIQRGMRIGYTDSLGVFQAFEIRKAKTYEPDHYQEITAEHIAISELTDEFFSAVEWTNITAGAALTALLTGTLWSVGTDTSSGTSSANIGNGNVWQDVRTIESNWNVMIAPRITVNASGITGRYLDIAPAGGTWRGLRLSLEKNLDDAAVTWDDSNLKTALFGYGKSVETNGTTAPLTFASVTWTATANHPAKPSGQTYIEDPDATAAYGRNGRARFGFYQNGDISDPEVLLEKTWETLKTVNVPDVSIDGTVHDLHRLGYTDVPLRLHDLALVEIRQTGVTLQKEIIRYTEDLLNPLNSRVTIGTYIPNIIYIERQTANRARGGRGGGSGGQTEREYELSEFGTEITANKYQINLRAYQRDMTNVENILMDSGVAISAQGTIIYANNNLNDMKASINTQADRISLVVEGTGANAHIKPAAIVASINGQTGSSHILISADQIDIDGIVTALTAKNVAVGDLDVAGETTLGDDVLCENDLTALGVIKAAAVGSQSGGGYVWLDDAVGSIGPATASGGQITIPWTKMDGTAGTAVNFNIADTQYYQDGVAAAELQGQTEAGVQINTEDGQIERALNSATKAVSITAAASIAYDSNTHQYTATGKARAGGSNIEMDSATATSGTEAYSAGVAAGEAEFTLASVTLQGEQQGVYVEAQSGGTDYYTAGSSVSYYPGNGGSFTVQGSALSYKIREYGYQQFYRKNSDGTYSAVGGERRWFWQNSEGNQYYNAGTVTKHDRGSAVSVTPINASSKKHLLNTIRYKAGTTVSNTYYTRSSS